MSDSIGIDELHSLLDEALGIEDKKVEQTTASITTELEAYQEEYTPPEWEPMAEFEGVVTRTVDAGWLFDKEELAGLMVQTYEGFENTCPIYVPAIPDIYIPNIDQMRALIISSTTGLKSLHIGHTGCGKTSGIEYFAAKTGRPFHRQECDQFTDDQKLFGSLELSDGVTYFNKSDLTRSLAYPAVLCIDEMNALPSATQMALNPLLDRRQVRVTSYNDDSETIDAHPEWMVCATSNTNGSSDDLDLYNSANTQDQAMINRLDLFVNTPYPSQEVEATIISMLAPDMEEGEVKKLAKFSCLCHKAYEKRELSTAFSVRNLKAITELLKMNFTMREAIKINYTNRVSKSDIAYVNTQVNAIW